MSSRILTSLRTAARVFKLSMADSKAGIYIETLDEIIKKAHPLSPVASEPPGKRAGYWIWTIEAGLFLHDTRLNSAVKAVFESFSDETQHAFTFAPRSSKELVQRAQVWRRELKPALPAKQYYAAVIRLLDWYIRCAKENQGTNL